MGDSNDRAGTADSTNLPAESLTGDDVVSKLVGDAPMATVLADVSTFEDNQPHEAAQRRALLRVDRRECTDPADVPAFDGETEWWYDEGHNHRLERGGIARDLPTTEWVVPVATLGDLWALVGELEHDGYNVEMRVMRSEYRTPETGDRLPTLWLSGRR